MLGVRVDSTWLVSRGTEVGMTKNSNAEARIVFGFRTMEETILSCIFLLSSSCMYVAPSANDDSEKETREREESGKGEGNRVCFLKRRGE